MAIHVLYRGHSDLSLNCDLSILETKWISVPNLKIFSLSVPEMRWTDSQSENIIYPATAIAGAKAQQFQVLQRKALNLSLGELGL